MQHLVTVFDIHQINTIDDVGGGAVETGTVTFQGIRGQINLLSPTQASLEQGLETPALADVFLRLKPAQARSGTSIIERDQLVIVGPKQHPLLNEHWRVISIQNTPTHPGNRRGFLKLKASRVEQTRTESLI